MAVPKIARIHLVYQFIILTLLVFAIGYNEILPGKKYLFLALIPVFCYQLMIVFCCTELLPLPRWMSAADFQTEDTSEKDAERTDISATVLTEKVPLPEKSPIYPKKRLSFKFSVKNLKTDEDSSMASDFQEVRTRGPKMLNEGIACSSVTANLEDNESTKNYYFPYRQKRLEEWLEPRQNARPYKVRNWKSVRSYDSSKSVPNQKSPNLLAEKNEEENNHPSIQTEKLSFINENDSKDLTKSYSYPFRQKKIDKWVESSDNLENDLNIPTMPPWKALNYCKLANRDARRRKSVSTEALDKELKLIKSRCQQKDNDFTQSMELTGTLSLDEYATKKSVLKPTTSFNKFRQGIVNCFNKSKKESIQADCTKQNVEIKKQFFKELFLSKESLVLEPEKKKEPIAKCKSPIFTKLEKRERIQGQFSPSYISFASDSFTRDAEVNIHPKLDRV